ncbi:FAD/NAD(P)-binding domain-containing protein [Whalleya microplaca]|nr:FAD/NAD(P)-binding domain-containing protein [Whalleya microplaca]
MKSFLALSSSLCLAVSALAQEFNTASYAAGDVIKRDVAIIGGGATGTYAAINLRDAGKSVVMIERKGELGGHTATYHDPKTGKPVNYGLQVYYDMPVARQFFKRLNINVKKAGFSEGSSTYIDFRDGSVVNNYTIPPLNDDYTRELHKYPYLEDGIHLPDPVPEDLLLTWSAYMKKFKITDDAFATYSRPAVAGDLTKTLALYVFNNLNTAMLQEQKGATIVNVDGDNAELYRKALKELGADVLLNSTVAHGQRGTSTADGVQLNVTTPHGHKLIVAKQLIVALPPVLDNLNPLGLDARESGVWSQFAGGDFYTGVVQNTGLPGGGRNYANRGSNTESHVAALPGDLMFNASPADGVFYYWYSALKPLTQAQVESATRDTLKRLQKIVPGAKVAEPQFVAYNSHAPLHPVASADAIRKGVYRDMYKLQGYRNTWYTGSLTVTGSPQLWNNTAQLLPGIIKAAK